MKKENIKKVVLLAKDIENLKLVIGRLNTFSCLRIVGEYDFVVSLPVDNAFRKRMAAFSAMR